jgi:hypothetical protein
MIVVSTLRGGSNVPLGVHAKLAHFVFESGGFLEHRQVDCNLLAEHHPFNLPLRDDEIDMPLG